MKIVKIIILAILILQVVSYLRRNTHINHQTSQQQRLIKQKNITFTQKPTDAKNSKNHQQQFNKHEKEKNQKFLSFLKTHKPEFDTISNCQVYDNSEECALCRSSFILTSNRSQCVKGKIPKCIEYATENTCAKCAKGFELTDMMHKCRGEGDYFDDGISYSEELQEGESDQEEEGSGINWNRPNTVPESNAIPDGEDEFDLVSQFLSEDYDEQYSDGELGEFSDYEQDLYSEQQDGEQQNQQQEQEQEQEQVQQQQQQPQQQSQGNSEIVLGGGNNSNSDGEANIQLIEETIVQQNKLKAFMALFDSRY